MFEKTDYHIMLDFQFEPVYGGFEIIQDAYGDEDDDVGNDENEDEDEEVENDEGNNEGVQNENDKDDDIKYQYCYKDNEDDVENIVYETQYCISPFTVSVWFIYVCTFAFVCLIMYYT